MPQELIEKRAALDRQITATKAEMLADATANAIACFTSVGFTTDEALTQLTKRFKSGARKPGAEVVPKYFQNGGSGSWTGRGRKPLWFIVGDYRVA